MLLPLFGHRTWKTFCSAAIKMNYYPSLVGLHFRSFLGSDLRGARLHYWTTATNRAQAYLWVLSFQRHDLCQLQYLYSPFKWDSSDTERHLFVRRWRTWRNSYRWARRECKALRTCGEYRKIRVMNFTYWRKSDTSNASLFPWICKRILLPYWSSYSAQLPQ